MQSIKAKIFSGVAAASLVASAFAPVALAEDASLEISGNGNQSHNVIEVDTENKVYVDQTNLTFAGVEVLSSAQSGGNTIRGTTGGTSSIESGRAVSNVEVKVEGGDNTALLPDQCGCVDPTSALISGNGNKSYNKINVDDEHKVDIDQFSKTGAYIGVLSEAISGRNKIRNTTGSGSSILTNRAASKVKITVKGGSNTLLPL